MIGQYKSFNKVNLGSGNNKPFAYFAVVLVCVELLVYLRNTLLTVKQPALFTLSEL